MLVAKTPFASEADKQKATQEVSKFVEGKLARHKWLAGGIEWVDAIPKSPRWVLFCELEKWEEGSVRFGCLSLASFGFLAIVRFCDTNDTNQPSTLNLVFLCFHSHSGKILRRLLRDAQREKLQAKL